MEAYTTHNLATELKKISLQGNVAGIHSRLSAIGEIDPSPVSENEARKGMRPFVKTVINAFVEALGPEGTLFVPSHSNNTELDAWWYYHGHNKQMPPNNGFYHPEISPSNVGAFTQGVIAHNQGIRSLHPTHSTAAIGKEARYLTNGHGPDSQPVGIQNAFSKAIGLDGTIIFIGAVFNSNTMFHAYETLFLPALAPYFPAVAMVEQQGERRLFAQTWHPSLHREFYDNKREESKSIRALFESGLMHESSLGNAPLFYYNAKEMARYFLERMIREPDILFCTNGARCGRRKSCLNIIFSMKKLFANKDGSWDTEKIRSQVPQEVLRLLEPGMQKTVF
ncbi:MAG: hypothetical protein A2268_10515 [Candidatus Raymondbacteria bacterium RifOxyA12_full_50_37]|uniref:Aminoglycoside N(3)-acetyltransferase n=1 Tax=Candidatus Raymondbacteria bacterium RIFOXYD12_FULL_49_13 TaxID=1817890 RepID=A0A1F7F8S7_UNCRA|nr:MAG: hypothetical protein A2268_10515 [Candidatus Raymondbacteria bacterium RifOxyA12_full_50_37]OGJ85397.1 MAG: hypothetical protein A2248_12300 [Candidatus Raymondbacteria bacterium RIFOXYA2_FULL_49_16]OGJ94905.1 MAG: hypothetical protein A2453_07770 [Candidatus Raymondbacteria bacterium RIFOXYC2_FULL_50_21]OGK00003.1 MAG: hypothetical protein A2487_11675 [Candidatus Raymondbacteria bacterium RifOxyC12_full_50_8]OGK01235.1 MAG: hypothetical protein A2350_11470 [Candidatus Raymondbacteria b